MSATDLPSTAMSHAKAYGLLFVVTVLWAGNFPASKIGLDEAQPVTVLAGAHVISTLVLAPLVLLVEGWRPLAQASWVGWGVLLYGAFPVTLGHLWYYQAVRAVGAGRAAVFTNLVPFLVIGLSWAILGEAVRWYHLVGACMVIAGVGLAARR